MNIDLTSLTPKQLNLVQEFCSEEDLCFNPDCTELELSSYEITKLVEFLLLNKQLVLARQVEDLIFLGKSK